jgi:hypothetical protein
MKVMPELARLRCYAFVNVEFGDSESALHAAPSRKLHITEVST